MKPTAKERHRAKLLKELTYWPGKFPTAKHMATKILGLAGSHQIYDYFSPEELIEIKNEAEELGKKKNIWVDEERKAKLGLLKKAQQGDGTAWMAYQKTEKGFTEKWKGEIIPIDIQNAPIEKKPQAKLPIKGVTAITEGEEDE